MEERERVLVVFIEGILTDAAVLLCSPHPSARERNGMLWPFKQQLLRRLLHARQKIRIPQEVRDPHLR
jgi:hypothetical protein